VSHFCNPLDDPTNLSSSLGIGEYGDQPS